MIRKRCKHAAGLSGNRKVKAWRECGCVWGCDLYIDGVRKWHNLGVDEKQAQARAYRLRADLVAGNTVRKTPGFGFTELSETWYQEKKNAPDARPGSLYAWGTRKKYAEEFLGDVDVRRLRQEHLNDLVAQITRERSAKVAANVVGYVSGIISWAIRNGVEGVPPLVFSGLVKPQPRKKKTHTLEDLYRVIGVMEDMADAAEFVLLTGLRRGEMLALDVGDVLPTGIVVDGNMDMSRRIGPTKTGNSNRLVRLSPRAREIVDARVLLVGSGRLWPVSTDHAGRVMRDAMRAAGVYVRGGGWHAFRDGHTALLNEAGVSIRDAAARLGHGENFAMTMGYGWASEQVDGDAVEEAAGRYREAARRHGDPGSAGTPS